MSARADSELYKDKIEVSLDGRQIFYLFFGGAVVACLVFVLGVMVGRRLEARSHVERAAATQATKDPLAALDQLAAGRGDLTFPQTLTGSRGGAADKVDRAIASMSDKGKADRDKDKAADKDKDKAAAEKAAADKAAADKAAADRAAKEKAEKEKAAAEKAAADKAAADKAAAAEARPVDRPDTGTSSKGKFTLQLSAFQDKAEAETFLGQVKGAGYGAYLVAAEVDGVMYYRVRAGTYGSYEDAVAAKTEFEKKVPKIAYVTRL